MAASQLHWVNRPEVQAITGRRAEVALLNAGAVRTGLEPGELKEGQVSLDLLPFGNPLSLVSLTGRQLAGLLLETINASLPDGAHAGRFPYVAGLRYEFDETRKGAGFLSRIEVQQNGRWVRVQPNASYQVVMNAYSASGNDGWNTLLQAQQVLTDRLDLAWVNGRLTAFPVARLSRGSNGAIETHYINQPSTAGPPVCAATPTPRPLSTMCANSVPCCAPGRQRRQPETAVSRALRCSPSEGSTAFISSPRLAVRLNSEDYRLSCGWRSAETVSIVYVLSIEYLKRNNT
ncbi:5'-nucleotidase C-terminal domain-containing protein [Oceanimonas sp. NS1]|nr:5'-nucleotidase C-terminal domain-containing protein [Oceanimonas sp. NS1]